MSKHTITTEIEVKFTPAGLVEQETVYPELEITYSFTAGSPATGPTYACGGTPAEPDEVELISAKMISDDGIEPTAQQINDWAAEWLASDTGYESAVKCAAIDYEYWREQAAELRRDDR